MKNCIVCGNSFLPKTAKHSVCSKQCKVKYDMLKRSKKPENKICIYCNTSFKPYTSLDKFCSYKCRNNYKKSKRSKNWNLNSAENRRGENNPAFKHSIRINNKNPSGIGQRDYERIRDSKRREMYEEFGFLFCERCNTNSSYQWEMHHLIYRSEKPNHIHLHNPRNLINLCISCHNWFHKNKSNRNYLVLERNLTELFGEDILR